MDDEGTSADERTGPARRKLSTRARTLLTVDELSKVVARLDRIVDKIDPLLAVVTAPFTVARRLVGPARKP